MSEQTEEEYLIERLSKLLAEISVIVNGPQPMGVLWSYADLPEKVQALKDAAALNAQAVPALEVFRIAGGDTECRPNPTADEALEVLRDLRQCYDEALNAQSGVVEAACPNLTPMGECIKVRQAIIAGTHIGIQLAASGSVDGLEKLDREQLLMLARHAHEHLERINKLLDEALGEAALAAVKGVES